MLIRNLYQQSTAALEVRESPKALMAGKCVCGSDEVGLLPCGGLVNMLFCIKI